MIQNEHLSEFIGIMNDYADVPEYFLSGSAITCDPPITDTDLDVIAMYSAAFYNALQSAGFIMSSHEEYPNSNLGACYRKGTLNIITCRDADTFNRWRLATRLCKHLNLLHKEQRVSLFQFITEGGIRGTDILNR